MANRYKDLTGKRFSRLVVKCLQGTNKHGTKIWLCKCDCGNIVTLQRSAIVNTHLQSRNISCGCVKKELDKAWGEMHRAKVDEVINKIQGERK